MGTPLFAARAAIFPVVLASISGVSARPRNPEARMTPASEPYPYVQGPAGRIRFETAGSGGLPVVFVHGNGGRRTQWAAQMEHLRPRRLAVALDLRGHGESDPAADSEYSVGAMAEDVAAVADSLDLPRFVLAGHSFGGLVAIACAARHPLRVAGLLLADPAGDLSRLPEEERAPLREGVRPENFRGFLDAWYGQVLEGAAEGVRETVLRSLRDTPRAVIVGGIEGMLEFDPIPLLERYGGPRLTIITGWNDRPYSLQNAVPDLPHRRMEGVSHWLMMDRPEEFNRLMEEFLAEVDAAEAAARVPGTP